MPANFSNNWCNEQSLFTNFPTKYVRKDAMKAVTK